jgi:hypothetical protein
MMRNRTDTIDIRTAARGPYDNNAQIDIAELTDMARPPVATGSDSANAAKTDKTIILTIL